jgi:malate/lactate dehydrogenase
VLIGAGGVERVIEIDLTDDEKRQFGESVSHVEDLVGALDRILAQ